MNRTSAIFLVLALVCAFSFGSIFHAVVPHDHDGAEVIWQELHAAVRHDSGKTALVSWAVLWILPLVLLLASRVSPAFALTPISQQERYVHRGIAKYRRFG